jgi:uncharacterized protein Yka (UPF0111/DUF47 family)
MLKALLPKEEKYFEDFKEMISMILEMGNLTLSFFSKLPYDKDIYLKLKPLERRCDELSSKVVKRLNKTFITPLDREDIFTLMKKIDDISDLLVGAASRIDIYCITEKVEGAEELAAIIVQQIKELEIVIQDLKGNSKQLNECKAVKDLESEADNVYRGNLKKLFQEEKDPINLFKKKEILDILENGADKCQSTANVILGILIKNS